jgi:N-acetyl sugar amidotransferase
MQAHLLKYKYGMHPLTCTWAPHIYTDWGWQNHQAWIHAGFDNILFTPNGRVHRLITRLAVENLFHPFQPFILGQKNLAPKIAALYDIPLIFYGENEAEYGNPQADMDSAKRSWDYFTSANEDEIFLGGASLSQLRQLGLEAVDWEPYIPINPNLIEQKQIEVHYLGYYEKWHPQSAYYYAIEHGGFQSAPERTAGTYSTYNSIDDRIDDFHYHTTWIKFGIGRATYDAAQEIRSGDLIREEGVALVRKYDGEFPERWAEEIFRYLSLPTEQFPMASKAFEQPHFDRAYYDRLSDHFRSPHLWHFSDSAGWQLRHNVFDQDDQHQEMDAAAWQGNPAD